MIVPFSEVNQKTGKPTLFIEKIWKALDVKEIIPYAFTQYIGYSEEYCKKFGKYWDGFYSDPHPKLHTLRCDGNDRYQPGKLIHPFINNRTKRMFQFASEFPVVSIQQVRIIYKKGKPNIYIDQKLFYRHTKRNTLAKERANVFALNDGFDSLEDFLNWFNEDFCGKIIHFTDLKY